MAQTTKPLNIRTMADDLQKIQAGQPVSPPSAVSATPPPKTEAPKPAPPTPTKSKLSKPPKAPPAPQAPPPATTTPQPKVGPMSRTDTTPSAEKSPKNALDELLPLETDSAASHSPSMDIKAQKDQPITPSEEGGTPSVPTPPIPEQPKPGTPPAPAPAPEAPPAPPPTPATPATPPPPTPTDDKNLESEIFPSPDFEEEAPDQAPEELLGFEKPKEKTQAPPTPSEPPSVPEPPKSPEPAPTPSTPAPPPSKPKSEPTQPKPPTPAPPPAGGQAPPPGVEPTGLPMQPPKKPFLSKTTILIGALVILGAALVGGVLYLIFSQEEAVTPPPVEEEIIAEKPAEEEPVEEEPVEKVDTTPPTSVVTPDFILDLTVSSISEAEISQALNTVADSTLPEESLTYVTLRLEGVVVNNKAQFVSAEEFLSALGVQAPEGLFDAVESDLMLYAYGAGEEERIQCQDNLITEEECSGPRLALAFRAKEGQEEQLDVLRTEWQEMAVGANLNQLVLSSLVSDPENNEFGNGVYTSKKIENAPEITVYFKNLLMPNYDNLGLSTTALDFAIVDNILVFATSKNSLETMIDAAL